MCCALDYEPPLPASTHPACASACTNHVASKKPCQLSVSTAHKGCPLRSFPVASGLCWLGIRRLAKPGNPFSVCWKQKIKHKQCLAPRPVLWPGLMALVLVQGTGGAGLNINFEPISGRAGVLCGQWLSRKRDAMVRTVSNATHRERERAFGPPGV